MDAHALQSTSAIVTFTVRADTSIAAVDLQAVDAPTGLCLSAPVLRSLPQLCEGVQSSVAANMVHRQAQLVAGHAVRRRAQVDQPAFFAWNEAGGALSQTITPSSAL